MFGPLQPTPFDLYFSILGIPVRVLPTFWLVGALMGWGSLQFGGFPFLFVWIVCLFFSILVHELGHAFTANWYGWPPQVYLYHFGGLAVYRPYSGHTTGRSILISFAGPVAGFVLYGCVWLVKFLLIRSGTPIPTLGAFAIVQLEWINLGWGLVNLLPVLPLDGGRICEAACEHSRPRDGRRMALKVSIAVAGAAALYFFLHRDEYGLYPGIFFAMLCLASVQDHQAAHDAW